MIRNLFGKRKKDYEKEVDVLPHYDLHAHIIPGVDDGAPDMETALQMLEAEIKNGVRKLILTPHFRLEEDNVQKIQAGFTALKNQAAVKELPIELFLGSEIYYDNSTLEKLKDGRVLTMADTRYVLIEFHPTAAFSHIVYAMDELFMAGYHPILAHAERCQCISEHLDRVEELVERGVYIQINANSFLNHPKRKGLLELAKDGYIHFVGTDCHRMDWRPVNLKGTCQYLSKHLEKEDYCRIFFENPQKLLDNIII